MNQTIILILAISIIVIGLLIWILIKNFQKRNQLQLHIKELETRFKPIISIDEEVKSLNVKISNSEDRIIKLKSQYEKAKEVFSELSYKNSLLKDTLEISEFGVYEPHFNLETSSEFKIRLTKNKDDQKKLIKEEKAAICNTPWTVGDSRKKGEVMVRKAIKLTLRAFNGECDSLIAKVKWNNIERYEIRIRKTYEAINKLNSSQDIHIQPIFLQLKIDELRLTHEFELKKQQEKEEQRRIREQMREEEKAIRDFERAQKEAEKEEKILQKAMKKAQEHFVKSSEEEKTKYEKELNELKEQLRIAEEKNQRAISMAQKTKSGHVYVISNIGSFGENVYKIGMTRRLEPLDRVNELGDASVPFKFDVHAMIYSENAPELENQLHKTFNKNRINHVNLRREYFDISLDEIEKVVKENHGEFEFIKQAEAKEYRESLIIKEKLIQENNNNDNKIEEEAFPETEELFNLN